MTTNNQERLKKSGILDIKRPVQIIATSLDNPGDFLLPDDQDDTKIIHFQRHGQGFHNLLGDVWRKLDAASIDIDSTDGTVNPWVMPELLDSPLTETGKDQCRMRRPDAAVLNPQLVVVSPLARAIQTAYITFGDHSPKKVNIPWIAHEDCREEMGLLMCNKRRPLSHIQEDYPDIDFSLIEHEEDVPFDAIGTDRRESPKEKTDRIYDFLVNYIRNRPEREIAVVGHSGWLFYMMNAVMDCQDDGRLEQWFLTSEVRSVRVSFQSSEE